MCVISKIINSSQTQLDRSWRLDQSSSCGLVITVGYRRPKSIWLYLCRIQIMFTKTRAGDNLQNDLQVLIKDSEFNNWIEMLLYCKPGCSSFHHLLIIISIISPYLICFALDRISSLISIILSHILPPPQKATKSSLTRVKIFNKRQHSLPCPPLFPLSTAYIQCKKLSYANMYRGRSDGN